MLICIRFTAKMSNFDFGHSHDKGFTNAIAVACSSFYCVKMFFYTTAPIVALAAIVLSQCFYNKKYGCAIWQTLVLRAKCQT